MFNKHQSNRRSPNPIILLFRLVLSLVMFVILLAGIYSAYKHFSGLDPLKLDPQAVLRNALAAKTPQQFLTVLSSIKLTQGLASQVNRVADSPKVLGQSSQTSLQPTTTNQINPIFQSPSDPAFKFLLIADSHNDSPNLQKAIIQAKQVYPDLAFLIGLGDYTNVGTTDELKEAKKQFDLGGLRYFLVPGDHDFWDSRNRKLSADTNFKQIFGPAFQSFTYNNFHFILLNDSDDYIGFGEDQLKWISNELDKAESSSRLGTFVFLHEPLYHPSSDHYMGKVEKNLKNQAESLIFRLKEIGVKKVFAGDIHYFSEYEEPVTKIPMVTIGAIATDRNPQIPRYAIVTVFNDGSTKVEDIEIK